MRRPIIAGNWKMNKTPQEANALAQGVVDGVADFDAVDVVLAPTAICIPGVEAITAPSAVGVAAQNMHYAASGAFTGELSAQMLTGAGCAYVILGHSERRQFFGETDEGVNQKVHAALAAGLTPIVCFGETLGQRQSGQTTDRVTFQVTSALIGLSKEDAAKVVLAYEPIWAIGTGHTATPEQAQEVHATLRTLLGDLYDADLADLVRIQYGGSVKPANVDDLINQPDIDGALVGGASLKADSFVALVRSAQASVS